MAPQYEDHFATLRRLSNRTTRCRHNSSFHKLSSRLVQHLKGAKREHRVHKASGSAYYYTEGPIPYPDSLDGPARTISTGEGGATASRFKHIIRTDSGAYRRLTPWELEKLNGFSGVWTDTGMSDSRRAFCMGNALIVGVIERIGAQLAKDSAF